MIYAAEGLVGLALCVLLSWRVRREYYRAPGRHHIRRRCLRYGTVREIRRHIRGSRVLTHANTFRSRVVTVASHELTTRNARYRVVNVLADVTVEINHALLAARATPTR
jgi:hypothetical protein